MQRLPEKLAGFLVKAHQHRLIASASFGIARIGVVGGDENPPAGNHGPTVALVAQVCLPFHVLLFALLDAPVDRNVLVDQIRQLTRWHNLRRLRRVRFIGRLLVLLWKSYKAQECL